MQLAKREIFGTQKKGDYLELHGYSPAKMDAQKDNDPAKPPLKGTHSVLYVIGNIPKDVSDSKWEDVSKHLSNFQRRKNLKGGEAVEEEYKVSGPDSTLLLFESAEGMLSYYLLSY